MDYHILEVRKVDVDGKIISSEFFVVDGDGSVLAGPFSDFDKALTEKERLEEVESPAISSNSHRP